MDDCAKTMKKISESHENVSKVLGTISTKLKDCLPLTDNSRSQAERTKLNDMYIQGQKEVMYGLNQLLEHVSSSSLKLQSVITTGKLLERKHETELDSIYVV